MSVQNAAIQVLKEAGRPLHSDEITKLISETGLWTSNGKTPAATVSARLYADIKKNKDNSPFVKAGRQTFALRDFNREANTDADAKMLTDLASKQIATSVGITFADCAQKVF